MKVISVIQPWATLLAISEKEFETRSWMTKYRGKLAIHASKKIDKSACREEPFRSILAKHGYNEKNLPVGVILATGNLVHCYQMLKDNGDSALLEGNVEIKYTEYAFGDYSEGRYAWKIENVTKLAEPISVKGQLGLWEYPNL